MIKSKSLFTIALGFRRGLLGKGTSDDMCFIVCPPLQGYLSFLGYETELVEGYINDTNHHFWLRLPDGRIIDPTADQFMTPAREPMPKVYIGPLPQWYRQIDPEPERVPGGA